MTTVGLRELRQSASELVRRVEAGEEITVSVSGRPAAVLAPVSPTRWRTWEEVEDLFRGPADPDWDQDRDLVDQGLSDPWDRR
jgi:prevent-host-death family protein